MGYDPTGTFCDWLKKLNRKCKAWLKKIGDSIEDIIDYVHEEAIPAIAHGIEKGVGYVEKGLIWIGDKAVQLYNHVTSSVQIELSVGTGFGGSLDLGKASVDLSVHADIGFYSHDGNLYFGPFGEIAAGIALNELSAGTAYSHYQTITGKKVSGTPGFEPYCDHDFDIGGSIYLGIGGSFSISIDFFKLFGVE